jgi:Zn-dependent alcohol dehydrogenase
MNLLHGATPLPGRWIVEDADVDERRHAEILARMVGSGVRHTDVSARRGILPTGWRAAR